MEINRVFRVLTEANIFRQRHVMHFLARQYGIGEPMLYAAIRESERNPVDLPWEDTTLIYRMFYRPDGSARPVSPKLLELLHPQIEPQLFKLLDND